MSLFSTPSSKPIARHQEMDAKTNALPVQKVLSRYLYGICEELKHHQQFQILSLNTKLCEGTLTTLSSMHNLIFAISDAPSLSVNLLPFILVFDIAFSFLA
jgi:hypothetical protein